MGASWSRRRAGGAQRTHMFGSARPAAEAPIAGNARVMMSDAGHSVEGQSNSLFQQLAEFFDAGDETGPAGCKAASGNLRLQPAKGSVAKSGRQRELRQLMNRALHHFWSFINTGADRRRLAPEQRSSYFAVFRPTTVEALQLMVSGAAVGKGLNVKGKSAKTGPLAGFVPFLQIHRDEHKAIIAPPPPNARVRVFFRTKRAREAAFDALAATHAGRRAPQPKRRGSVLQMAAGAIGVASSAVRKGGERRGGIRAAPTGRTASDLPELRRVDQYAPLTFGLDIEEVLFWETYVRRQSIAPRPGFETGRQSEPTFMELNLHATRDGAALTDKVLALMGKSLTSPRTVLLQWDSDAPLDSRTLLMAYEELEVKPVVSDMDALLIGSTQMQHARPLPPDQVTLLSWLVTQLGEVLAADHGPSWTRTWLEVLKRQAAKGFRPGTDKFPVMPEVGYGDPASTHLVEKMVSYFQETGAVRHGAECFNCARAHDASRAPDLP